MLRCRCRLISWSCRTLIRHSKWHMPSVAVEIGSCRLCFAGCLFWGHQALGKFGHDFRSHLACANVGRGMREGGGLAKWMLKIPFQHSQRRVRKDVESVTHALAKSVKYCVAGRQGNIWETDERSFARWKIHGPPWHRRVTRITIAALCRLCRYITCSARYSWYSSAHPQKSADEAGNLFD